MKSILNQKCKYIGFVMIFMVLAWSAPIHCDARDMDSNAKFTQIDTDGNGSISNNEMKTHEAQIGKTGGDRFRRTDTNGDGVISGAEFNQHEQEKNSIQQKGKRNAIQQSDSQSSRNSNTMRPDRNRSDHNRYSVQQAISDRAQLHTIAFSGLAFLTGDFGAATFIPPGKVCDFFGFQYMRDIDAAQKGHNPMFLNRIAGNVFYILSEEQKQMFWDLAKEQAPQLEELAIKRLDLIQAFHLQRDGKFSSAKGLNKEAVMNYVGYIFAFDAKLSIKRAQVMAKVASSLTDRQKAYMGKMKFGDFSTWPARDERGSLKRLSSGQSKLVNVAYMTYASEFFSWYKGSVKADTYFCPERHGTYFGGFYMKDMPAMGKRDYDISTSVTDNSGERFLNILSNKQRKLILALSDQQRQSLMEIVDVREKISTELRNYLKNKNTNTKKIIQLGRRYGELDGKLSFLYVSAFSKVNQTLTNEQRIQLNKLRNLKGYQSAAYYIYSEPVHSKPVLKIVDRFFH